MKGYPSYFRNFLYLVVLGLIFSGVLIIPNALEMRLEWSVPWALGGDVRLATYALHAVGAFVTLFIIGSLWIVHVRSGWKRRKNHRSGVALLVLMGLLLLSGIGLYYAGEETAGRVAVITHMLIGLAVPLMLGIHIAGARLAQAKKSEEMSSMPMSLQPACEEA